jgi:hypothetical protein
MRPRLLAPALLWCLLVLVPDPCSGWWGKERASAGKGVIERARSKAVEAWRIANATSATAEESLRKASALDASALDAKAAAEKAQDGGLFSKKTTQEEVEALAFAAKEAHMLGPDLPTVFLALCLPRVSC